MDKTLRGGIKGTQTDQRDISISHSEKEEEGEFISRTFAFLRNHSLPGSGWTSTFHSIPYYQAENKFSVFLRFHACPLCCFVFLNCLYFDPQGFVFTLFSPFLILLSEEGLVGTQSNSARHNDRKSKQNQIPVKSQGRYTGWNHAPILPLFCSSNSEPEISRAGHKSQITRNAKRM